jgi:hypothetical protein
MRKQRFPLLLVVLVALFTALAAACSGGDDNPIAATNTVAPQSTLSPEGELQRETSRPIRNLKSTIETIDTRAGTLRNNIGRDFGARHEEDDIIDELSDAEEVIQDLMTAYEEAGEEVRLGVARQLGVHTANIEALVVVLALLPTSDGSESILDDVALEVDAFTELLAGLG